MIQKKELREYAVIVLGAFIMGFAIKNIYDPANLVTGGVSGIAIIVKNLLGIPLWLTNTMLNIPLFLAAWRLKGWSFIRRTLAATVSLSLSLYVIPEIPLMPDDLLLSALFGGIVSGIGTGLVFMYLATTMGSILNGMGHTSTTFIQNIVSMILRLAFILFGIPRFGIRAYLWGILASEILLASMNLYSLSRQAEIIWAPAEMIVKPALILILSIGICRAVVSLFPVSPHSFLPDFFCTAIEIALLAALYLLGLGILHIWKNRLP